MENKLLANTQTSRSKKLSRSNNDECGGDCTGIPIWPKPKNFDPKNPQTLISGAAAAWINKIKESQESFHSFFLRASHMRF